MIPSVAALRGEAVDSCVEVRSCKRCKVVNSNLRWLVACEGFGKKFSELAVSVIFV